MSEKPGIPIRQTAAGIVFNVRVIPRASRPGLAGIQEGALKLRLAAPPVEGKANDECIRLLAQVLGVKKGQVTILAGHTGRTKTVAVAGIGPEAVTAALPGGEERE